MVDLDIKPLRANAGKNWQFGIKFECERGQNWQSGIKLECSNAGKNWGNLRIECECERDKTSVTLESNSSANAIRIGNLESNLSANVIRIGNLAVKP